MNEILKARYPFESTDKIAIDLGLTIEQVYRKAASLGLKKSHEYLSTSSSGRYKTGLVNNSSTQFKPGHIPLNKGQKMSKDLYDIVKRTMFKKGNKPFNTQPNGTINIRKDTSGKLYKYIKIADSKWKLYQRYVWENSNGAILPGMIISFKDKNPMNCVIENLEIITRKENMNRNTIHNYPTEVKQLIKLNSKLKKAICQKTN